MNITKIQIQTLSNSNASSLTRRYAYHLKVQSGLLSAEATAKGASAVKAAVDPPHPRATGTALELHAMTFCFTNRYLNRYI